MDQHLPGAEDWYNCICWTDDDEHGRGALENFNRDCEAIQPDTISSLCDELNAYCDKNGLPHESADELLVTETVQMSDRHQAYLQSFIERWDAVTSDSGPVKTEADRVAGILRLHGIGALALS